MQSLPTLPRRTWLERASLMIAIALIVMSTLTLAGWWLQVPELVQPFRELPPLKINGAIGFCVVGVVLLAIEFGRRKIAALALVPAAIALVTFAQDILRIDFRIDELFG